MLNELFIRLVLVNKRMKKLFYRFQVKWVQVGYEWCLWGWETRGFIWRVHRKGWLDLTQKDTIGFFAALFERKIKFTEMFPVLDVSSNSALWAWFSPFCHKDLSCGMLVNVFWLVFADFHWFQLFKRRVTIAR
jgi:hypothetical protein